MTQQEREDLEAFVRRWEKYWHRLNELTAVLARRPEPEPAHGVEWHGVFRGTDADPREVGFCATCNREVYDGDGSHRRPEDGRKP
jgi:hypothetical protein